MLNVYTAGSAYNTSVQTGTVFIAGPHAGPAVKASITDSKSPFWDPSGYEPAVIVT
jgi:hypothetical protein